MKKESLVTKLFESHALVDSLKFENNMVVENNKSLDNELQNSKKLSNRLSSDNLKNLFCFQKNVSNKPSLRCSIHLSTSFMSNIKRFCNACTMNAPSSTNCNV